MKTLVLFTWLNGHSETVQDEPLLCPQLRFLDVCESQSASGRELYYASVLLGRMRNEARMGKALDADLRQLL